MAISRLLMAQLSQRKIGVANAEKLEKGMPEIGKAENFTSKAESRNGFLIFAFCFLLFLKGR